MFPSLCRKLVIVAVQSLSRVSFATPWDVACQAPLSMGFPRQEYWSGLPFPPPGDLLDPGIQPASPSLAGRFFTTKPSGKSCRKHETKPKKIHFSFDSLSTMQFIVIYFKKPVLMRQRKSRWTDNRLFSKLFDFVLFDFDCVDYNKLWQSLKEMGIPDHLICHPPPEKSVLRSSSNS